MGTPVFMWWGVQQRWGVDPPQFSCSLPDDLSDLQITPKRDVQDVHGIAGGRARSMTRAWIDVRIVYERFTDLGTVRELYAMINHLERGGCVSFAVAPELIWGNRTYPSLPISINGTHTRVNTYIDPPNIYSHYHASAPDTMPQLHADGSKVYLEIEDGHPRAARSRVAVLTATSAAYTDYDTNKRVYSTDRPLCDFPKGSHVRHRDFFPKLYLPQSQVGSSMLSHDHRISYTLDLRLSYRIPDNVVLDTQSQIEAAMNGITLDTGGRDLHDFDDDLTTIEDSLK